MESPVGSCGDSYDDAPAETISGLCQAELIHQRAPCRTVDDVELETLSWVDWFNHRRLLRPFGDTPSSEHKANYYERETESAMVA